MKKITQKSFELSHKKEISSYTKALIDAVFLTKPMDKIHLLSNIAEYSKNTSYGELILKQTLLKGCFAKVTWQKQAMLNQVNVSSKITAQYPKEVSDVRFLTEIFIADNFAKSSEFIKELQFKTENPKIAVATASYGNKFKDVSINFQVNSSNVVIESDIKSGNNALDIFKGALGVLPIAKDFKPYSVINENHLELHKLQEERLKFLLVHIEESNLFYNNVRQVKHISEMALDPMIINKLIQEELLKCLAANILPRQPSFYTPYKITTTEFNDKYFKYLEPYINKNIFDNKENFNSFMTKAIFIYNSTVEEISKNVKDDFWKGTGFENIADEVFK